MSYQFPRKESNDDRNMCKQRKSCSPFPHPQIYSIRFFLHTISALTALKKTAYFSKESILGLQAKVVVVEGLEGWLLWEAARSLPRVQQSQCQPAPTWTYHWPRPSPSPGPCPRPCPSATAAAPV